MSNNVVIPTTGTGTATPTISTEDIGSVHYQRVKLVDGTAAATTVIVAGNGAAASALRVTIADDSTGVIIPGGNVAHDAADSGNPVKIGGKAVVGSTPLAVVADADRANLQVDGAGRVVVTTAPRGQRPHATTTISASTSETTVLAAGAAGIFHDLTMVTIANTSATAVRVDFKDATSGTIRFSLYAPAGATVGFSCDTDPVEQASAAANWTATSSASVTDLRIFVKARATKG